MRQFETHGVTKPLLMGEFGAFKSGYPDITAALNQSIRKEVLLFHGLRAE